MLEVQALTGRTAFGMPRRVAAGTDYNRVNVLMAVLEKRCRMEFSQYDAYVNIAGGMRMSEPALDLAIVTALISSYQDIPVDEKTVVFGEVGLSGEVRAVSMAEQRVREALKLGFTRCIMPRVNLRKMDLPEGIRLEGAASVSDVIRLLKN
jgi:DNA repair protein RadA/Sms